jgi:flavin-binding protein dodecin
VADHTYGITEIVGTSPDSVHQAIRNGIARASRTVRNLDWFEVSTIRGYIEQGDVAHFQVQMKVGFRIEDSSTE